MKNRVTEINIRSKLIKVVLVIMFVGSIISCSKGMDNKQNIEIENINKHLVFSTYLGGTNEEQLRDLATDNTGNIYITDGTESPDFPTTAGAYDRTFNGWHDVYVTKLDPKGKLIWSTFIGGTNYDRAYAIEVDSQGNVFVAGRAGPGYPTTAGTVQPGFGGDTNPNKAYGKQDGFVTKLSTDGSSVIWSTYFGDDDRRIIRDMDIDDVGNVYVGMIVGTRSNPHITKGAFQSTPQGGKEGIVAKLSPDGEKVLWATYLGGSSDDISTTSVHVDELYYVYTVGATNSIDIPTTKGAYDTTYNGGQDVADYILNELRTGSI